MSKREKGLLNEGWYLDEYEKTTKEEAKKKTKKNKKVDNQIESKGNYYNVYNAAYEEKMAGFTRDKY
jgi:hypothetical protein